MVDYNMSTAYRWANELGEVLELSSSLNNCINRAKLVDFIDKDLIKGSEKLWTYNEEQKDLFLKEIANKSRIYMYDVNDEIIRKNVTLRLWAGCLHAAKY